MKFLILLCSYIHVAMVLGKISSGFFLILLIGFQLLAQGNDGTLDELAKKADQAETDTAKVNAWIELAEAYMDVDPQKALDIGNDALKYAGERKFLKGEAQAQRILGKIYAYSLGEPVKALTYLGPALRTFREIGWKKGEGMTLSNIGTAWYYQNEVDSALSYWTRAQTILMQIDDPAELVKVQLNIGNAWAEKGDVGKATRTYEDCIRNYVSLGNKDGEAKARFNLARLHRSAGDLAGALDEFLKALSLWEGLNNKTGLASCLEQIADTYRLNSELDKALEYSARGIALAQELNNKKIEQGGWLVKGMIHGDRNEHEKALECYTTAQKIGLETGDQRFLAMAHRNTGNEYARSGRPVEALTEHLHALAITSGPKNVSYVLDLERTGQDLLTIASIADNAELPDSLQNEHKVLARAEEFLSEALGIALATDQKFLAKNIHEALSRVYKQQGDWRNAHEQYLLYRSLQDSIFSSEGKVKIARLEAQREAELKEKEIQLQRVEIESAKRERWYILGGSFLLLALAGLSFNRYRLVQHNRRLQVIERVRSRISRDLHDDMGSTLSSINLLTHSARKRLDENDIPRTSDHLRGIEDRTTRMLGNMRDIIWNIKPDNDTLTRLIHRMEEHANTVLGSKGIIFELSYPDPHTDIRLPLELKHDLYLIFKEAVNNMAKHSNATKARISLTFHKGSLEMVIQDNGIGIADRAGHGDGLVNMKERAKEVNGELHITAEPGKGTRIALRVAIPRTWEFASKAAT